MHNLYSDRVTNTIITWQKNKVYLQENYKCNVNKNVAKKRFLVSNTMAMYVRARIGTYAVLCKTTS